MVDYTNDKVRFRLFEMPCCKHMLCWVNSRLPSHCPMCGKHVFIQMKSGEHTCMDSEAWLKIQDPIMK